MELRIKRHSDSAILPQYAHPGDAGMDLYAIETVTLPPGAAALIKTGISIELPPNTEAQIRPRSGLALHHAVTVLNTPGTIDEGYRGEIGVILINHGQAPFQVTPAMRIAQMVITPVIYAEIAEVETLTSTNRGQGGFGSTGHS
ncbi:dUTP diphosphatase [Halomicronema sp. CCY15110]|uniref:dUTP diphosphatase n=1 Tax=Halomicronema sp. CCY15110 TaxID=2767773 RepID=UPI001950D393|nr:dUTP diphosphatase [Halomicronema sp. CCY15110]